MTSGLSREESSVPSQWIACIPLPPVGNSDACHPNNRSRVSSWTAPRVEIGGNLVDDIGGGAAMWHRCWPSVFSRTPHAIRTENVLGLKPATDS